MAMARVRNITSSQIMRQRWLDLGKGAALGAAMVAIMVLALTHMQPF